LTVPPVRADPFCRVREPPSTKAVPPPVSESPVAGGRLEQDHRTVASRTVSAPVERRQPPLSPTMLAL
jgi:hypothetical protein